MRKGCELSLGVGRLAFQGGNTTMRWNSAFVSEIAKGNERICASSVSRLPKKVSVCFLSGRYCPATDDGITGCRKSWTTSTFAKAFYTSEVGGHRVMSCPSVDALCSVRHESRPVAGGDLFSAERCTPRSTSGMGLPQTEDQVPLSPPYEEDTVANDVTRLPPDLSRTGFAETRGWSVIRCQAAMV